MENPTPVHQAFLVLVTADSPCPRYLLRPPRAVVGTSPDSDIVCDDAELSPRHAELVFADSGVIIRDLDSVTGTYVNGERTVEHRLNDADVISVGSQVFRFEWGPQRAEAETEGSSVAMSVLIESLQEGLERALSDPHTTAEVRRELRERQRAAEADEERRRQDQWAALLAALDENGLGPMISAFARRHLHRAPSEEDRQNLLELIYRRGIDIELEELDAVLARQRRELEYADLEAAVRPKEIHDLDDLVRRFVDLCETDAEDRVDQLIRLAQKQGAELPQPAAAELLGRERRRRELEAFERSLLAQERQGATSRSFVAMDHEAFHSLLERLFEKLGYTVGPRTRSDPRVDLTITKFGQMNVVRAKRSIAALGKEIIEDVIMAIADHRAARGIVVSTSAFTDSARELARSSRVEIIDSETLCSLVEEHLRQGDAEP